MILLNLFCQIQMIETYNPWWSVSLFFHQRPVFEVENYRVHCLLSSEGNVTMLLVEMLMFWHP